MILSFSFMNYLLLVKSDKTAIAKDNIKEYEFYFTTLRSLAVASKYQNDYFQKYNSINSVTHLT